MKYKLLKDLPLAKVGTKVELKDDGIHYAIMADEMIDFVTLGYILSKDIPEWLEEVKEPKTIYDLKKGDTYWWIDTGNQIDSSIVIRNNQFDEENTRYSFVTEREAKRNQLLRMLATRQDKWLPENNDRYITYGKNHGGPSKAMFECDNCDYALYNLGLVFRNEEEYNKYMTEEAKDLLFNI